jgi:preprotein translocase subunit SecG
MSIIYGFLLLVEALVSALLIGVIFLQKTKGGMGGTAFGGGMGEAIFGSRMGNVLTKSTVVLGVIFLINTILLTMLTARRDTVASVTDLGRVEQAAPIQGPGAGGPIPAPTPVPVQAPAPVPIESAPLAMPEDVPVVDIPAAAPVAAPEAVPVEIPAPAPAE